MDASTLKKPMNTYTEQYGCYGPEKLSLAQRRCSQSLDFGDIGLNLHSATAWH